MEHLINHRNCSHLHQIIANKDHRWIEASILSIFLLYVVLSNLFVIVVTIGSSQLRGCLFSMQLAATYAGNLIAGSSLLGNDIYFSAMGIPPICQSGKDRYLFLYFGLSLNMIILVLNTNVGFKYFVYHTPSGSGRGLHLPLLASGWVLHSPRRRQ